MIENTINANIAECIVTTKDLLSKTIYNICNGNIVNIPYGNADIVNFFIVCVLTLSAFIGIVGIIYITTKEIE